MKTQVISPLDLLEVARRADGPTTFFSSFRRLATCSTPLFVVLRANAEEPVRSVEVHHELPRGEQMALARIAAM